MNIHANDRVLVLNPNLEIVADVFLRNGVITSEHWLCNLYNEEPRLDYSYFQFGSGFSIGGNRVYQERTGLVVSSEVPHIDWESIFCRNFKRNEYKLLADILYNEHNYERNLSNIVLMEKLWGLNMARYVIDCNNPSSYIDFVSLNHMTCFNRIRSFASWTDELSINPSVILALVL